MLLAVHATAVAVAVPLAIQLKGHKCSSSVQSQASMLTRRSNRLLHRIENNYNRSISQVENTAQPNELNFFPVVVVVRSSLLCSIRIRWHRRHRCHHAVLVHVALCVQWPTPQYTTAEQCTRAIHIDGK